jgi:hypothetical protein
MINFMSSYQCQDKKGKHYHPKGHLCWYGCNAYGEPNGFVQPIKRVPEFIWIYAFSEKGYQKLKKDQAKVLTLQEIFTNEPRGSPMANTDTEIKLHQDSQRQDKKKRRLKNASKENRNK